MVGFELEEALFNTAPVGVHCVDSNGIVLWANTTELNFFGFTRKEEYIGQYASSFVYSDNAGGATATNNVGGGSGTAGAGRGGAEGSNINGGNHARGSDGNNINSSQQSNIDNGSSVNLITADDKTLYKEVLKRVTVGNNPINEIPVRFVTRSGTVIHLLLDCDGTPNNAILPNANHNASAIATDSTIRYYRFFTRDDTARRIQEMRSNVLFQETNRSLQMLDNFMNRSMQQMRSPLTLMERACNLVTENIEDIDEVIRRNYANAMNMLMSTNQNVNQGGGSVVGLPATTATVDGTPASSMRRSSGASGSRTNLQLDLLNITASEGGGEDNGKPHALQQNNPSATTTSSATANAIIADFSAPLSVALSATLEARSVVGLASTLTKDALALVDDITDLCRFDQGRVLLVEKEAVKVRDICLEALNKVPIPVGSGGLVDVILDVQEGAPGRTMTDRSVLQRCLALLLNFAVDAAANAASTAGSGERGRVILSLSDAAMGQPQGSMKSACKISVFYTNPPASAGGSNNIGMMGAGGSSATAGMDNNAASGAFASAYSTSRSEQPGGRGGNNMSNNPLGNTDNNMGMMGSSSFANMGGGMGGNMTNNNNMGISGMTRGNSFGTLPAIFGECYSKPNTSEDDHLALLQQQHQNNYHSAQGGSMMRRIRLRESIQNGMTSCRRDKLGLGLSLLYHLVGAQGSDLRYEIVGDSSALSIAAALPSMTKFWFLLPMSLDFPDRLPADHFVKDDVQGSSNARVGASLHRPSSLPVSVPQSRTPTVPSTISMATDDVGAGSMQQQLQPQQPPQKRARLSTTQLQPTSANPLNNIPSANIMGAMDNTSMYNRPESATSVASAATAPTHNAVAQQPAPAETKQYPGVAPGARPLVLVVEDTDVSASLLCMHLRKLNCTSHRAENGEVALEMLRSAPTPNMYSLILMDLRMPVMDGFEATKIIKGSNARHIPVVALTGETSLENRQRCDEIGFDDYKTKPLKRPQLKELLNKLVPGYVPVP